MMSSGIIRDSLLFSMTNFMPSLAVLVTLTVALGCGGASRPATTPPALAADPNVPPCTATVPSTDVTSWRAVAADGFTFCVPADWQQNGQQWRGGSAKIAWGTGEPPARTATTSEIVTVPSGSAMPSRPVRAPELQRFKEDIGGRTADVFKNRYGSHYFTGARWSAPAVWMDGEASSGGAAELQIKIYRTVRFPAP